MSKTTIDAVSFKPLRLLGVLAISVLLFVGASLSSTAQDDQPTTRSLGRGEPDIVDGETKPSKEMDLAFALLGQVSEVLVKEGDRVEAGQVLIKQDVAADVTRLQGLEAKADVAVLIALAERQRDLAEIELEAVIDADTAMSPLEKQRAELELKVAETRIDEQKRQGRIESFAAEEQRILIEYKQIRSPESGIVRSLDAAVGEVFGPQTPAMRVVKIDPLHVHVFLADAARVMQLKLGDVVQVRYKGEGQWRDAKVVYLDPVANPSGELGRIPFKLELPNPEGRPAGLRMDIRLPTPQRAADAGGR
jgi:multidrug efflux pump subunit AcrA (membrane-fusion protein)